MNDLRKKILSWIAQKPENKLPEITLGKVIKRSLRENDLEIKGFAENLDVTVTELSLVLSDRFRPAIQVLKKISDAIDYSYEKLCELADLPTLAPLSLPLTRSVVEQAQNWSKSQKEDAKFIEQILKGNNDAFGSLYDKYFNYVQTALANHISSERDVEDLIQESWKKAYLALKRGSYSERGQFKSWLSRVVSTCRLDWLRKLRKSSVFCEFIDEFKEILTDETEPAVLDKLMFKEDFQEAVNALTDREKHIYTNLLDGKSTHVLAIELNTSVNTVSVTYHRAREKVKMFLK